MRWRVSAAQHDPAAASTRQLFRIRGWALINRSNARADCFQGQSERRASYIVPVWSVRLFVLMLDRLGIRSGGEGRSRPRSMPRAARRLALGERRECFS
jgi:hypothetical protein